MANSYHVLVVEDRTDVWEDLTEFFEPEIDDGILTLDFAATAKEGLEKVDADLNKTDVVIIDVILPDAPSNNELYFINSLDTKVKEYINKPKGILVSAHKSIGTLNDIASQKDWIVSAFVKPLSRKMLKQAIEETLNLASSSHRFANISGGIDENLLREVRQEANVIKSKMKRSVSDIIDAGKRLHAVKKRLPHGYFKKWIETELGCHYTTGVNLMRVAEVFGDNREKVSNMGVAASILYFLATPSTPRQAREKVIQLIEDGENISYAETKQIVREYRKNQERNNYISDKVNSEVKGANVEKVTDYTVDNINSQKEKESAQNKQQILKVIRQQPETKSLAELTNEQNKWYKLGNHLLFNGYPNSESFHKHLPESISLTIAFPDNSKWSKAEIIPDRTKSISIFYSPFKDLDLSLLKTIVTNAVELCTEEGENVVFSFLPEPEMLLIADSLGCRCIIAEPNLQQCHKILSAWENYK